jgi:hypothetical protein
MRMRLSSFTVTQLLTVSTYFHIISRFLQGTPFLYRLSSETKNCIFEHYKANVHNVYEGNKNFYSLNNSEWEIDEEITLSSI